MTCSEWLCTMMSATSVADCWRIFREGRTSESVDEEEEFSLISPPEDRQMYLSKAFVTFRTFTAATIAKQVMITHAHTFTQSHSYAHAQSANQPSSYFFKLTKPNSQSLIQKVKSVLISLSYFTLNRSTSLQTPRGVTRGRRARCCICSWLIVWACPKLQSQRT